MRKERWGFLEMDEAFKKQYFNTFLKAEQEERALQNFGTNWDVGRNR